MYMQHEIIFVTSGCWSNYELLLRLLTFGPLVNKCSINTASVMVFKGVEVFSK